MFRRLYLAANLRRRVRHGRLEPELHARERRAQLVRRVRHELSLRLNGPFHAIGHLVERMCEVADLARPPDITGPRPEVAGAQAAGGTRQRHQGLRERPRETERDQQSSEESAEPDHHQPDRDVPHGIAHLLDVACDPDRAPESLVEHGRRRDQDVGVQREAVTDLRRRGRGGGIERCLHLGPAIATVVDADRRATRIRVGQDEPSRVHHDDAPDVGRVAVHEPVQCPARRERLSAQSGGDRLRLDLRLVLQLRAGTVPKVDRERNGERDDHRDQDVGERRDEPGADLRRSPPGSYGSPTSAGAANRNPTPRIVVM